MAATLFALSSLALNASLALLQAGTGQISRPSGGLSGPAYASDGRLAVAMDGDLWVKLSPADNGRWVRVSTDRGWDREPAWTRDGTALVFSSDREGGFDLWR